MSRRRKEMTALGDKGNTKKTRAVFLVLKGVRMDTQSLLSKYRYEPSTGQFRRNSHTPDRGVIKNVKGYIRVFVGRKYYMAHHLVWLLHTGRLPNKQIDHINGKRDDNRFSNLREVSPLENSQNQRRAHKTSSTGLLGVSPIRQAGLVRDRWKAQIKANGRPIHLGVFGSPDEAHQAYLNAKRKLHPGCTI